jgi:uncharacterized protein (TIGR02001 family)
MTPFSGDQKRGRLVKPRRLAARPLKASVLAAVLLVGFAAAARAGDADATAEAASTSKLSLSANLALTTDYIFRGFSQTDEGPAIQGGFELGYKNFYLGVWGSNVNFGGPSTRPEI